MAHVDTGLFPTIPIRSAQGSYLTDTSGRRILDAISSWWTCTVGHCHPKVVQAIQRQAGTLDHVMFAGFTHAPAKALAEELASWVHPQLSQLFFSDDGSTAVEAALKIALQYWHNVGKDSKRLFVTLNHAYHGDTVGAMSLGNSGGFHGPFQGLRFKSLPFTPPDHFWQSGDVLNLEPPTGMEDLLSFFRQLFETNAGQIAALFLEPLVLGAGGMKMMSPALLQAMVRIARSHDCLIIFDEVMTGFGRTGKAFAMDHLNLVQRPENVPDLVCLSKGITGGTLPLGVTLTQQKIYDAFLDTGLDSRKTFFHGHSYTANPIICAAACAALQVLREESLIERTSEFRPIYLETLRELQSLSDVHNTRMMGTILAMDVNKNQALSESFSYFIFKKATDQGILLRPIGQMIYLMPPLCTSGPDLSRASNILLDCVSQYGSSSH
jgi:adenosylmethionine-8-amino-7-oxononanoate aminotransferase